MDRSSNRKRVRRTVLCGCLPTLLGGVLSVGHAQDAALEEKLRARCLTAIDESGVAPEQGGLDETLVVPAGEGGYLFQWELAGRGTLSCQLCDADNRDYNCASLGLQLSFKPTDADLRDLPAELDRKCVDVLQKDVGDPGPDRWIDHDVVQRIGVEAGHTETRWVYRMTLDGEEYRCVIRKSDGRWRVERRDGEEWDSLGTAGRFF